MNLLTIALLSIGITLGVAFVVVSVRLARRTRELEAISEIGTALSTPLDPEKVFSVLATESAKLFAWDFFFIALASSDKSEVRISFLAEQGWRVSQKVLPWGEGLTGRAMESGRSVVWTGAATREGSVGEEFAPRSIVVAPMVLSGEAIGAISIQSYRPNAYGASATRFLETVAAKAAGAIRNAQLFESEQRARHERDLFFSLVTHEMKTPLSSVTGYAELAARSVDKGETRQARESLDTVIREARRISEMAEDVLDEARLRSGHFSLEIAATDAVAVVNDVVRRLGEVSGRVIECVLGDHPIMVELDRARFEQVIENLVSNALKYSHDTDRVCVGAGVEEQELVIRVQDEGQGIPPEALPFVFERFFRVGQGSQKGTGLGLFVTREIVAAHGGRIDVESTLEEGSTFTVRLPLAGTK